MLVAIRANWAISFTCTKALYTLVGTRARTSYPTFFRKACCPWIGTAVLLLFHMKCKHLTLTNLVSLVNISAWCQWWIFQPDFSGQYFSLMSVMNISAWCQWWLFQPDVSGDYFSLMSVVNISAWCQWWLFEPDVSGEYFSLMSVVNISA